MNKNHVEKLRPFLYFFGIPIAIWLALAYWGFMGNYSTIFGRYEYIGPETMSMFGNLDLAHYQPVAAEEFWSWQFFFGNLPYFIICAFLLAGYFHMFHPVEPIQSEKSTSVVPKIKQKKPKTGIRYGILGGIILGILTLEVLAANLGDPETGWGTHLYTHSYYRDIPTLLREGFYPQNCLPNAAQLPASFLPLILGGGCFPYLFALRKAKHKKITPIGAIFFGTGILWLIGVVFQAQISVQMSVTGYTLSLVIIWSLTKKITTGLILLIQKDDMPDLFQPFSGSGRKGVRDPTENHKFNLKLWAHNLTQLKANFRLYPWMISFVGMLGTFIGVFAFFIIKSDAEQIEIGWLYNAIIPIIFTCALTALLYLTGNHLQTGLTRLFGLITKKMGKISKNKNGSVSIKSHSIASRRKKMASGIASIILFIILVSSAPLSLAFQVNRETPEVLVNQLGLLPAQEKVFFLQMDYDHDAQGSWQLIDIHTGDIIADGILEREGYKWKKYYWKGDFTAAEQEGEYILRCTLGKYQADSYPFAISQNYLDDAFRTGLYWYYHMRCGTEVKSIVPGYPGHEKCHYHFPFYREKLPNGTLVVKNDRNATGGWHDSGDYNTYGHLTTHLSAALGWTYEQVPDFFSTPALMATYPQNDSVPDIMEEAWHGVQFWKNRWHEGARKFFDTNGLGNHQSIRWTVFGPPEAEDFFGGYNGEPGRWIHDESSYEEWTTEEEGWYEGQFLGGRDNGFSPASAAVVASLAAFINNCDAIGWQPGNRTELVELTLQARQSYNRSVRASYQGITCEEEMWKLTGNHTYFENAARLAEEVLLNFVSREAYGSGGYLELSVALAFALKYNATMDGNLLDVVKSYGIIDALFNSLMERTDNDDGKNIFRLLRKTVGGAPGYNNGYFFNAMMAACYGYNLTADVTQRREFFNFITRHYDWIYGKNFENICQIEGVPGGDQYVYQYDKHRYRFIPGLIRGGAPGFILDGYERFAGDYGSSAGHCGDEDCNQENRKIVEPETNLYTETWSVVTYQYMMMNGAFYKMVLNRG